MAAEIKVPTLGESVTEATVAQWLKQAGDTVEADEPLVELETDKVTLEVNAPEAGTLSEIVANEGDTVEVGALLGKIGEGSGAAPKKQEPAKEEKAAPAEGAAKQEPKTEAAPKEEAPAKAAASGNGAGKPVEIKVPTLGESVSEATVAQWLKQAGDSVAADEALVELETDKVTLEVNAPTAGTLSEIKAEEGATVEVGALLGIVAAGAEGGSSGDAAGQPKPSSDDKSGGEGEKVETPTEAVRTGDTGAGSTSGRLSGRGLAPGDHQEGTPADLDPSAVSRSGAEGKITAEDLRAFLLEGTPPSAATLSPAVAKLIADKGIDPNAIQGTGPKGRITKEDVLKAAEGGGAAQPAKAETSAKPAAKEAPQQAPATGGADGARSERVKMPKLRQTIAKRLKEAQNTAAMLTTFNEADMTEVMALRSQFKEDFEKKHGVRLGFTSFFTKAVVKALKEVPAVNARIDGDEIVYNHYYDVGMAVSTPNGLMVPVVRDCDSKSFAEIEQSLGELAGKGRDGKLSMQEMQGGTFTITNGGVFGSLLSTPILNMPQSGILGLHKIQERAMVVNGEVVPRPMMYLALSYDHRIIDGREAVTFLVKVKEAIEDPSRMLLDM